MNLRWIHENPPRWDARKQEIVGAAPAGVFEPVHFESGQLIPAEWWRVEDGTQIVGYGWMDTTWGDAEVLLAVDPAVQGRGVGTFILDHLEREAASRGLNYLYNVVRPAHPKREETARWLTDRGFVDSGDDLLKRHVPPRS
jgi:GNAT superfamily N-acetyltransferase